MIRVLLAGAAVFLVSTFPATWLLMLFFGNVGMELSYGATLPLGVIASMLIAGASTPGTTVVRA